MITGIGKYNMYNIRVIFKIQFVFLGSRSKSFCYLEEEIQKWEVIIEEVSF